MKGKRINRILILSWEIFPMYCGGLGHLVKSLVDELRNQGADVTILVPRIIGKIDDQQVVNLGPKIEEYLQNFTEVKGLSFSLKNFRRRANKKINDSIKQAQIYPIQTPLIAQGFAQAFREYIEKNQNFDLIIGMDWVTIPSFAEYQNLGYKTPFAFYINGTELDRNYGTKRINKTPAIILELEKRFYKQAPKIITVSDISKNNLLEYFEAEDKKITVVYNDFTFVPFSGDVNINPKQVLFVGRMTYQKGLIYLLRSARKVIKQDKEVIFVLAGNGDERQTVDKYIKKYQLEKNFKIIDWIEGEEKAKLYAESSLFYMPSVSEPFGLTAIEAIRSGIPVLSSSRCGFCGVVPSTPTFDYHNTTVQADLILKLLKDSKVRNQLIKNQQRELSTHSWKEQVAKIFDLLP